MRILDQESDRRVDRVTIYLTLDEAKELRDSLQFVILRPQGNHAHIPDATMQKEVTVCIYDQGALDGFDQRSLTLIREDQ